MNDAVKRELAIGAAIFCAGIALGLLYVYSQAYTPTVTATGQVLKPPKWVRRVEIMTYVLGTVSVVGSGYWAYTGYGDE